MRILTTKGRTNGKLLAFGRRGTYNPANRESGVNRINGPTGIPIVSRGPARKLGIPKQDPKVSAVQAGMR
jgi:hypothetical protein